MLKKPASPSELLTKMQSHGIVITDPAFARKVLSDIGYYRLSGYALQFRKSPSDSNCIPGTTFNAIYDAYCFDSALRNILRTSLEIVEVYYKSLISNGFASLKCMHPPHDQHYDRNNYYNKQGFDAIMHGFQNRGANYYHDSPIMQHHQAKYHGQMPLWVLMELLSFSNASMLFSAMYISDQDRIASPVGVSRKTLVNHLHCLAVLRNKCAHCARLYNTKLRPAVSFNASFLKKHPEMASTDTVFAYVLMLMRRLPETQQKQNLCDAIINLVEESASKIELRRIGFPNNYRSILLNNVR